MSSSVAPVGQRALRLEHLDLGRVVPVREADGGADRDVGPFEDRPGAPDVGRPHAHGGDVVLRGQPAAVLDERVVELRPQERVVDRLGDVVFGQAARWRVDISVPR